MKSVFLLVTLMFFTFGSAQSVFGKWKTVDDETGEEKSIIEIFEKNGKVFGKVIEILTNNPDAVCSKCEGTEKNQPILGLHLIKEMTKDGKYYKNGTIFDPNKGKKYKCRLYVDPEKPNQLQVRGYIGFLYKSQYWIRVN